MFLTNTDDSWTSKGMFNGQWYCAISDEKRFKEIDKGGAIYTLPSDTFTTDLDRGMGRNEWISKVPIKPSSKKEYDTCLTAMILNNVKVIFVNQEVFHKFRKLLRSSKTNEAFELLFSFPDVKRSS